MNWDSLLEHLCCHLLENGYDIRPGPERLGRKEVGPTMVYTHVLKRGGMAVRSPVADEKQQRIKKRNG